MFYLLSEGKNQPFNNSRNVYLQFKKLQIVMPYFLTLEDLFYHQLRNIYSAEKQLIDVLSGMAASANHSSLMDIFIQHWEETKTHKKRLESISEQVNINIEGVNCDAVEEMINRMKPFISQPVAGDVNDAGMIANGHCLEHYEISAYSSLVRYADALCYFRAAKSLEQTMIEESNTGQRLNELAIETINKQAKPYVVKVIR